MRRSTQWGAMGALLVTAIAVRIAAFTGPSFALGSDESRYIALAHNLANGFFPSGDTEWFGTRVVLLWPVAALFAVFGSGDVTAAIWPLVGSLTAVVAAFAIGRELRSPRVGLVAAALVALAPLEVLVGTTLRPDALMPGLIGLSIWAALRAARHPGWIWPAACGALLACAWSTRESALVVVPVVLIALRPRLRASLAPVLLGFSVPIAATMTLFAIGAGSPLRPVIGAGTEGDFRNPFSAFDLEASYLWTAARGAFDPGNRLFLALPIVAVAVGVVLVRRHRDARLPGVWLALAALYVEFGTLVNLGKPLRYLTLCTIPAALLVALAIDGRFAFVAPIAAAAAVAVAIVMLPARQERVDEVLLTGRIVAKLRQLPPGPVVSENYTLWAKLTTYTARTRLPIRAARDPEFLAAREAADQRRLEPLPTATPGGYVVTAPFGRRAGWPSNWDDARRAIGATVARGALIPIARVDRATIWRWPR